MAAGELPAGHPSAGVSALDEVKKSQAAERARLQQGQPRPTSAARRAAANGKPPASPAPSEGGQTTQKVEQRLQWLRQLEAQLGMEGVVIPSAGAAADGAGGGTADGAGGGAARHPTSRSGGGRAGAEGSGASTLESGTYDVEARLERLRRLEAGVKEKEELDTLLESYLREV